MLAKGLDAPDRSAPLQYTAPTEDGDVEVHSEAGVDDQAAAKPVSKARRKKDGKRR